MTIDKQKLLQWIEEKKFVYSVEDGDSEDYRRMHKGMLKIMTMLERDIEIGWIDTK